VPGKTKSIQARIASNQKDQEKMSDRLEMLERRMRAQYSALDTTMAKANALSKYVQQQFYTKSIYDNDRD
jgi:flagellar hook-associated protein 2